MSSPMMNRRKAIHFIIDYLIDYIKLTNLFCCLLSQSNFGDLTLLGWHCLDLLNLFQTLRPPFRTVDCLITISRSPTATTESGCSSQTYCSLAEHRIWPFAFPRLSCQPKNETLETRPLAFCRPFWFEIWVRRKAPATFSRVRRSTEERKGGERTS